MGTVDADHHDASPKGWMVALGLPRTNIQALLDHIETSGDPIFWG